MSREGRIRPPSDEPPELPGYGKKNIDNLDAILRNHKIKMKNNAPPSAIEWNMGADVSEDEKSGPFKGIWMFGLLLLVIALAVIVVVVIVPKLRSVGNNENNGG